jgi:DNA-binding transcriptional MocR family regulator
VSVEARAAWLERARGREGPRSHAIVQALDEAMRTGEMQPGDRLPTQRAAATQLGVDLTTVTRAYAVAQTRGLVEGTVGRGTFVRAAPEEDPGVVDLSMNLPPPPDGLSLGALLGGTSAAILARADPTILMSYHPGFGTAGQRLAGAQWLAPSLGPVEPERVIVAPGAQTALAAILADLCRPGDAVVTEPLTYPGLIGLARQLGLTLVPCPVDADGPIPEALSEICAKHRPKALYVVPTMQNPTASTMPESRRRALAAAAHACDLWVIEDDPYARLLVDPPPALAALAPERTFHVATLAKCLSPGLRVAYAVCPEGKTDAVAEALRSIALMPAPLMVAVATRWIQEGVAEQLLQAVRKEVRARRAIAATALPQARGCAESLHVWLPFAGEGASERLRSAAQDRGLALVTAGAFAVSDVYPSGARISLGGPSKRRILQQALEALAEVAAVNGELGTGSAFC